MKGFMIPKHLSFTFLFCMLAACAHSGVAGKEPHKQPGVYASLMEIYRGPLDHLSAVRRGQCPMHPSCSEYSRQAVEKHGLAVGWAMTLDRLMRCGRDELKLAPMIYIDGTWKYYDPVENNDFWWGEREVEEENR